MHWQTWYIDYIYAYEFMLAFEVWNALMYIYGLFSYLMFFFFLLLLHLMLRFLRPLMPLQCDLCIAIDRFLLCSSGASCEMNALLRMTYVYDCWSITACETIFVIFPCAYIAESHFNKSLNQMITMVQSWRMKYNLLMKLQVVDLNQRRFKLFANLF